MFVEDCMSDRQKITHSIIGEREIEMNLDSESCIMLMKAISQLHSWEELQEISGFEFRREEGSKVIYWFEKYRKELPFETYGKTGEKLREHLLFMFNSLLILRP